MAADLDLAAAFVARFGRPRARRRRIVRPSAMGNGFKSVPQPVSALVAAVGNRCWTSGIAALCI